MSPFLACCLVLAAGAPGISNWEFDDIEKWRPAYNVRNMKVDRGKLTFSIGKGIGFMACDDIDFPTSPYQYVEMRVKTVRPGEGNLMWAGDKIGDCTWDRRAPFQARKKGWQTIVIFPFWHTDTRIKQLRLDFFGPASFEIDYIRVKSFDGGMATQTDNYSWDFRPGKAPDMDVRGHHRETPRRIGGVEQWRVSQDSDRFFAPPLTLNLAEKRVVTIKLRSSTNCECAVLYGLRDAPNLRSQSFRVIADGKPRYYNVRLAGMPVGREGMTWSDPVCALGLEIPTQAQKRITVESVSISDAPSGPADLAVGYFGFENAINRAGKPCEVVAEVANVGGEKTADRLLRLELPKGLRLAEGGDLRTPTVKPLAAPYRAIWPVIADAPGEYTVRLLIDEEYPSVAEQSAAAEGRNAKTKLRFLEPVAEVKTRYVPRPQPVKTSTDLFMYYFPGWESGDRWYPAKEFAPQRKPWLGYYDEHNVEMVDWQIKAAVENGITGFMVDWYWWSKKPELTHWMESYAKAKYRDYLKVMVMWCNHLPADSVEDLRNMTRFIVDNYFCWPSYYRVNGKPVIAIYEADRLRQDLGGSENVRKALQAFEAIAVDAGYPGITWIESGMRMITTADNCRALASEGYYGFTTYHDNLQAYGLARTGQDVEYADVTRRAWDTWEEKRLAADRSLTYLPYVETGWDARPWHGEGPGEMVIRNRAPELFEQLLRKAKRYAETYKPPFVMLGPANEWGEGSYIEPCVEYDFDMYERVRKVFGLGDPKTWPVNIAPSDVGLGPYESDPVTAR